MTERDIFLALLDLPDPTARATYLNRVCSGDTALRVQVESLLRAHDIAGSFLGSPVVAVPAPDATATRELSGEATPDDHANADVLTFLTPPSRSDSLGRIGHYEVLEILGRGGFGIVFRAFDEVLQRVVAVKVMAPQMAATSPARKRFLREARSSAKVRHENVVQVYAVEEQPLPYLVMEFIPGETLQQRLDRTGPVEVTESIRIGCQLAEGLAAAHSTGLIHRDVKPGNILIEAGPRQHVKLTDFGLARAADDASLTQSGLVAGTPMFMSPEQANGETLDHRADLFSLGSVLYTMASGRPPFRANSTVAVLKRVAEDTPRPIREIIPETPQWLCDIISKLHAKDPDDRYQSAREVADVLADWEASFKANSKLQDFSRIPHKKAGNTRRWKWTAAVGVLACVAAVGLAVYTLNRPGRNTADIGDNKEAPNAPAPAITPGGPPQRNLNPDRRAAIYVLSIGGAVRVNDTDEILGTVEQLPKTPFALTRVHLRDNAKATDEGLVLFQGCRNVKHLDLAVTKVTDAGLANFKDCLNLTVIDLFSTNVSDIGLAHFKGCQGLTHLSLRSTRVTDATAADFGNCTELTYLGLGHTQVTEAGLANFRNCKKLKHLDLDLLPVGDAGLAYFADCKNLETVHVGGTQVTDVGVARFKECKGLRILFLRGTKVSAAAIDDLKAALPQCKIEWNGGVIDPTAHAPLPDAELKRIAALPAKQVEEVRMELKKRNPDFDGTLTPTIENGVVTGLEFLTANVTDVSPVQALSNLKVLICRGVEANGKLADLSPLRGIQLVSLDCNNTQVADLSPLKGMPLKRLYVQHTRVAELAPLAGMSLEHLNCSHTRVAELSPLKSMKLLSLYLDDTKVADLTPLKGMPLRFLNLRNVNFQPTRDGAILRSLDQLEEIDSEPAAGFLKKLEANKDVDKE